MCYICDKKIRCRHKHFFPRDTHFQVPFIREYCSFTTITHVSFDFHSLYLLDSELYKTPRSHDLVHRQADVSSPHSPTSPSLRHTGPSEARVDAALHSFLKMLATAHGSRTVVESRRIDFFLHSRGCIRVDCSAANLVLRKGLTGRRGRQRATQAGY